MNISAIKDAKPGDVLWDKGSTASIKGLHLRVYANGRKSFLFYYRTNLGDQRRPKLGDFPDITLAEARTLAAGWALEVAKGEDPKAKQDQAKGELTVQELFDVVYAKYWSEPRFIQSGRNNLARWAYNKHFKRKFGKLRLSQVTRKLIRDWHSDCKATPYSANRSLEFLNTMFVYAEKHELVEPGKNPCRLLDHFGEKKRKRYATPDELRRLAEILERESEHRLRQVVYIWILLFSGSRPKFISDAKWDHLRVLEHQGEQYGMLSLAGKSSADSGEDEVVILPPQAMKHLNRLPRTSSTITGIGMPKRFWMKIRDEANCSGLRARDLRRTFATVGMSNGVSLDIVSGLLNHKSVQTTKIYGLLMEEKRIEAAKEVADAVERTIWPTEKSNEP